MGRTERSTYEDEGVHAAVSWTYARGKPQEALLRIRRALKEPRGDWNAQDQRDWEDAGLDG